jgi:hypothetical protein
MANEIEENLVLNIEQALEAIDAFARSFEQSVAAFSAVLADSLTQIFSASQTIAAELDLNPGDSEDVVQDAIGPEQVTSITFEDTNASDVGETVQSELSGTPVDPISVPLEGEDEGVAATLVDALSDPEVPEVVVPIDADASQAQSEAEAFNDFLSGLQALIEVEVDTTDIEAASQGLDELDMQRVLANAVDPQGLVDLQEVAVATEEASAGAEKASFSLDDLSGAFSVATTGAKLAAGAFTALAAASAGMFTSAVEAQGALVGFQTSLGPLAPAIKDININGLNIDLAQLAQNLGSGDEAVLGVAQRFAQLGITSDASSESIAKANSELFGVAGNLRAVNPGLGELDQIASRAGTAFIRGGRAAAALGLSLTAQEIKARASQMTQKGLNEEFTQFELFAAGAELAAEQFGSSIDKNIAQAAKNPIIALSSLKQQFGDAIEEFGKPLIAPMLQVIETGLPSVLGFSEVMSRLAQAVFPAVISVVEKITPIAESFFNNLVESADRMGPSFDSIGEALGIVLEAFGKLAEVTGVFTSIALEGLLVGLQAVSELIIFLGEGTVQAAVGLFVMQRAFINLQKAMTLFSLNPWIAGLGLLALAAASIFSLVRGQGTESFEELSDAVIKNVGDIGGLTEALDDYLESLNDFILTEKIAKDTDLGNALRELGITAQQFARYVEEGEAGYGQLVDRIARDPRFNDILSRFSAGQKLIEEGYDSLNPRERRQIELVLGQEQAYRELTDSVEDYTGQISQTSKDIFEAALIQEDHQGVLARTVRDYMGAEIAAGDYNAVLEEYQRLLEDDAAVQAAYQGSLRERARRAMELTNVQKELSLELLFGVTSSENFADAMERMGMETSEIEPIIAGLEKAIGDFTEKVLANVPSVIDAFSDLGEEGVSSKALLDDFEKSLEATREWSATLIRLADENKTGLLAVAAELGPERTRLLIETYGADEEALNEHLQRVAFLEMTARVEAEVAAKIGFLKSRELYEGEYEALAALLRDKAFFGPLTKDDLDEALANVENATPGLGEAAVVLGAAVGDGVSGGLEEKSFAERFGELIQRIKDARQIDEAVESGRQTGLIIGEATTAGLVEGLGPVTGVLVSNLLQSGIMALSHAAAVGTTLGNAIADNWRNTLVGRSGDMLRILSATIQGTAFGNVQVAKDAGGLLALETNYGYSQKIKDSAIIPLIALGVMLSSVAEQNSDNAYNAGFGLGADLMGGLAQGISANIYRGALEAARAVRAAETAARDEAESDSPSKAWERLGRDLVAGLSKGLDASSAGAARSAAGVISSATPSAAGATGPGGVTINVPVTVTDGMTSADGRRIGEVVAGVLSVEMRNLLRLEARVA